MTPPGVAGHNRPHRTASCPAILMGAGLAARKSPNETRTGNGGRFAGAVGCAGRGLSAFWCQRLRVVASRAHEPFGPAMVRRPAGAPGRPSGRP
jgi:hypothetical protein